MPTQNSFFQSPVGILEIKATDEHITALLFANTARRGTQGEVITDLKETNHLLIQQCKKQLTEYFEGKRTQFDLPLQQEGSAFQQKVWTTLTGIPYGRTISYTELSKRIGDVKAIRAVGTTNGKNSLSIIVPCHRVIGSNGDLTGYGGDLWRKKWLLDHEAKYANGVQTLF
ncbi:MAG: methylated-DNA--[protein]-cysteine S-methyltransferase [Ferruginibacter sp.]